MNPHRNLATALFLSLLCTQSIAEPCAPYVEEQPAWTTAMFRPHSNGMQHCEVSEETYRQVVHDWLQHRALDATRLTSISLGRAENFPWLSHHLADTALNSPEWRNRVLRAGPGEHNHFVADLLSEPDILQRLDQPFQASPYRVLDVSVEKVLAGKASEYATEKTTSTLKVPFDAQVWLRLGPRE